jgi:hypothetical protein
MTSKSGTDSEEVWDCQLITSDESDPPTVRYNKLAYERKLEKQVAEEAQPLTQKSDSGQPITQRAVPKR